MTWTHIVEERREPLTLTADQAAAELGWQHRDGRPYGDLVRSLYRSGRFPPPIDATLSVRRWRWSRRDVVSYGTGQWRTDGAA